MRVASSQLDAFDHQLQRIVDDLNGAGPEFTPVPLHLCPLCNRGFMTIPSDIKALAEKVRTSMVLVQTRAVQSSVNLDQALKNFHAQADTADALIKQIDAYSAELQAATAQLSNGGPPLNDGPAQPVAPSPPVTTVSSPVTTVNVSSPVPVVPAGQPEVPPIEPPSSPSHLDPAP